MKIIGVIRSIGERTEDFSKYLLKKQVNDIFLVKNIKPIKNMTIECLKIGINSGADYMITCDSDVFILPGVVDKMVNISKKNDRLLITGHTMSKFFNKKLGGIRIWDCSKLKPAMDLLLSTDDFNKYRPEAFIHKNFNGLLIDDITSYHEYEQYYHHIYDKFINQSYKDKNISNIVTKFINETDIDFKVAYRGFFDEEKDFKKSFPNLIEKNKIDIKELEKKYLKS